MPGITLHIVFLNWLPTYSMALSLVVVYKYSCHRKQFVGKNTSPTNTASSKVLQNSNS